MPSLFTSIPPDLKRTSAQEPVGRAYQLACLQSWKRAGFDVVSLNPQREIRDLDWAADVRFVEIDGVRPKISEFFAAIRNEGQAFACVANADCLFTVSNALSHELAAACRGSVVLAERHNVNADTLKPTGEICYGFDAFFFDTDHLAKIDWSMDFFIGETWWDYFLPLAALRAGCDLRRLSTPFILHLDHPTAWNRDQFVRNGLRVLDAFPDLPLGEVPTDDDHRAGLFAVACFEHIREAARPLSLALASLPDRFVTGYVTGVDEQTRELKGLRQDKDEQTRELKGLRQDKDRLVFDNAMLAKDLGDASQHITDLQQHVRQHITDHQQLAKSLEDAQSEIGHLTFRLDEEIAKQKRLVGFESQRIGELFCTVATKMRPFCRGPRLKRLVSRIDEWGINFQLRAAVMRR